MWPIKIWFSSLAWHPNIHPTATEFSADSSKTCWISSALPRSTTVIDPRRNRSISHLGCESCLLRCYGWSYGYLSTIAVVVVVVVWTQPFFAPSLWDPPRHTRVNTISMTSKNISPTRTQCIPTWVCSQTPPPVKTLAFQLSIVATVPRWQNDLQAFSCEAATRLTWLATTRW